MGRTLEQLQRFFRELKRRNVYRVAATYAVVGFVLIQVADLTFVRLGLPSWTVTLLIVLVAMGFPLALVLAWAFELTPEGVRRTPRTAREETEKGRNESWSQYVRVAATLGLLLLVGWGAWRFILRSDDPPTEASSSVVAVLPFSVQGSAEMEYLGEGMVNLLTTKFDGAGELRSVDARALLSHLRRAGDSPLDPDEGQAVAQRFGAGFFVMGDIVEVRGHVTLNASLYDVRRGLPAVEETTVEGAVDSISSLVDDLAAPLLASVSGGSDAGATRMAALTTNSLPALKAYIEGESALREGDYRRAFEAFRQAVVRDTLFALGYYRMSVAGEWLGLGDPMIEASDRALRNADRLNDRYARLLTAFRAFRRGDNRRAEELYRAIVTAYPDNVEGWLYLGEVVFHTNPYRGESISEAWEPFVKVTEYEPGNVGSLVHMIRIAALERRPRVVDSLVARYERLNPEGDRLLSVRALQASVQGDDQMWRRTLGGLEASSPQIVGLAVWSVGIFGRDVIRATELARLLTREHRTADERSMGFQWLAMMQAAGGQWKAADRTLTNLEDFDLLAALETRGFIYLIPHAPVSNPQLRKLRNRLEAQDASNVPVSDISSVFINAHNHLHPLIRTYVLGRLNARLGDSERARSRARELVEFPVREAAGTLSTDLAHGIRAEIALQKGDSSAALEEIARVRTDVAYNFTLPSFVFAEVNERLLRAELLRSAGRHAEAVTWYENHVATSIPEISHLGPVHLGLARSHEHLGHTESAARHYTRFIELWKDADKELRPRVEAARERHQALTGAEGEDDDE